MRVSLVGLSILMLSFCSCGSNETVEPQEQNGVEKILVKIEQMEREEPLSRLTVTENVSAYLWEVNDTIGVFPVQGGQVEFPISNEDAGKSSAMFDGGAWALRPSHTYAAYYPFNFYNRDVTQIPVSYLGQIRNGNNENERTHLRNYMFFAAPPATVENGQLSFSLSHMGNVLILHLTMPVATTYTSATIYTDAEVIPVEKTINLQDASLTQTTTMLSDHLTIGLENITTTTEDEEVTLWVAFPSMSASDHTLKVVVYDTTGVAYTADITRNDYTTLATAKFSANGYQNRYASPTLNSGFNIGIHDWGDGEVIEGTLQ